MRADHHRGDHAVKPFSLKTSIVSAWWVRCFVISSTFQQDAFCARDGAQCKFQMGCRSSADHNHQHRSGQRHGNRAIQPVEGAPFTSMGPKPPQCPREPVDIAMANALSRVSKRKQRIPQGEGREQGDSVGEHPALEAIQRRMERSYWHMLAMVICRLERVRTHDRGARPSCTREHPLWNNAGVEAELHQEGIDEITRLAKLTRNCGVEGTQNCQVLLFHRIPLMEDNPACWHCS